MSLRIKSLLIVLAAMAVLSFVVALITTTAIDEIQTQYEADLASNAEAQMALLGKQLEEDMARLNIDPNSQRGQDMLKERAKTLLGNNDYIMRVQMRHVQDSRRTTIIEMNEGEVTISELEGGREELIGEMMRPLLIEGQEIAMMSFDLATRKTSWRLQAAGQQIRRSLTSLTVVLFLVMLATFLLLWRTFKRHMEASARSARLKQMAYVGSLAGGLAHEIRNPLHAMSINLSVIQEELDDPRADSSGRMSGIVERLQREVGELNQSVTSFLEYARPERARPERIDLLDLVRQTARGVTPALEAIGGSVNWKVDLRPPQGAEAAETNGAGRSAEPAPQDNMRRAFVMARPASLAQALSNIMTNAVQAMAAERAAEEKGAPSTPLPSSRPSPRIDIEIVRRAGAYLLAVRDNGPGIPPEDQRRIFDVFFSKRPGGSGFGLAIARRAVADEGGRIWVESRPGHGATFFLTLPAILPSESAAVPVSGTA